MPTNILIEFLITRPDQSEGEKIKHDIFDWADHMNISLEDITLWKDYFHDRIPFITFSLNDIIYFWELSNLKDMVSEYQPNVELSIAPIDTVSEGLRGHYEELRYGV